ncbi:MAG: hypothetical protein HOV73_18260 [Streptomyces sp.]|nr:hypothetical protein [Streptomyces sp.]NUS25553.1 hypothetical protein [Streptomyces sp.]NUS77356.1 hypothetical protein [Streptomyces sp.]
MTAVDGRDALAAVIVRPAETHGNVTIEAFANGLGKEDAAYILRNVAEQWDGKKENPGPPSGDLGFPATWDGGHSLVVEYGDCELYGRCQCGETFGSMTPDMPLDGFASPWERHVMGINRG